ncbi:hypothetical protein [Herpetosiphon sp.]|uniref:hypothetical protein n=1 Tax=Herpetosiphon sp. TaxID=71864 RepID=UPI0000DDD348|nr:hypothetical protein [Herpetosiphon sp.]
MRFLDSTHKRRTSFRLVTLLSFLLLALGMPATFASTPQGAAPIYLPAVFNNRAFVMSDGFQFANYGGNSYQNLTPVEMRRLYGS